MLIDLAVRVGRICVADLRFLIGIRATSDILLTSRIRRPASHGKNRNAGKGNSVFACKQNSP